MKNHKFLYNNKTLRERRRELRNNQTEEEKLLWSKLQKSRLGMKFVRQYSVGPYILDFYCPNKRLAIELDGSQHSRDEALLYDRDREEYLEALDIKTMRFKNSEVRIDIERVLNKISSLLK